MCSKQSQVAAPDAPPGCVLSGWWDTECRVMGPHMIIKISVDFCAATKHTEKPMCTYTWAICFINLCVLYRCQADFLFLFFFIVMALK